MKNKRLRVGDEVVVVCGNNKGKVGKILSFRKEDRVVVEGVNVRKKHMKKSQANQKGQIIDIECAIHISNVKPSVNGSAVKLKARFNNEGEKELFYSQDKKDILYRPVRKSKS